MSSSSSSSVQILSSSWTNTIKENKKFERALIAYFFDESDPQRREKTDMMFPGKNPEEIVKHDMDLMIIDINNIEAGLIELPAYHDHHHHHNYKLPPPSTERSEPKKYYLGRLSKTDIGTSNCAWWDKKEHRNFLQGLLECGKGQWAAISRNFVHTKTPMQVATHAQKYFLRLESKDVKSKKRSSIFDITTADIQ